MQTQTFQRGIWESYSAPEAHLSENFQGLSLIVTNLATQYFINNSGYQYTEPPAFLTVPWPSAY